MKGKSGMVGVAKFAHQGHIFMGTPDNEEIVLFMEPEDIIAVSALNSTSKSKEGIKSLIFFIKRNRNSPSGFTLRSSHLPETTPGGQLRGKGAPGL
nr:hypothetical protein [Methanobacterium formicicum]